MKIKCNKHIGLFNKAHRKGILYGNKISINGRPTRNN